MMRSYLGIILLVLCLTPACTQNQEAREWRDDLAFLQQEYPLKHKDFYLLKDSLEFNRELEDLGRRVPGMNDKEIILELQRILARMGVSHSGILFYFGSVFDKVAIQLELFDDGLFLTSLPSGEYAGPAHRIVRVNGLAVDAVLEKLGPYISYENLYWRDAMMPFLLVIPDVLAHAGIGREDGKISYMLGNGEEIIAGPNKQLADMAALTRLGNQPWREKKNKFYWYTLRHDSTLYLQYNSCQNDPDLPFTDFVDMLRGSLEEHPVQKFILDLRLNHGGNSMVLKPLTVALKEYPGLDIYVAMSRQTFSSGTFAVRDFKKELGATLVGEPTGGSPVSYGEMKRLVLPNKGVRVAYCVKHFRRMDSDLPYFEPDIHIPYLSEDYFARRDPVLEYLQGTVRAE